MAGRVRRIALTGGIATGKSHVRAELERLGVLQPAPLATTGEAT